MDRGKSLIEMLKFNSNIPHENVVDLKFEKRIYRYDPQISWFTAAVIPSGETATAERCPLPEAAEVPISGWMQMPLEKSKGTGRRLPFAGRGLTIPKLNSRTIRIEKTVYEFLNGLRSQRAGVGVPQEAPDQLTAAEEMPEPTVAETPKEQSAVFNSPVSPVPAPAKRKSRPPAPEKEVKDSKPLKVIRRRKEQPPKIFERHGDNRKEKDQDKR